MTPRSYSTPAAFKQSLETRLRTLSSRQRLPLERLRLLQARATRDVDLRCSTPAEGLLARMQEVGRHNLGDWLRFEVRRAPGEGLIQGAGVVQEGLRFKVQAFLDGKVYGMAFGLDVSFGDVMVGEPEPMEGSELLEFMGLPRPRLRLYPRETHSEWRRASRCPGGPWRMCTAPPVLS